MLHRCLLACNECIVLPVDCQRAVAMVCGRQKLLRAICVLLTVTLILLLFSSSRNQSPLDPHSPVRRPSGRPGKREDPGVVEPFLDSANFTIVIQTYRRNDLLHRLLSHYCKFEAVDRIIIVWNNVNESVPDFLHYMPCGPQLFYLEQHVNTIRNRFQPFPQIRTEGIASVDDDRLISEEDLMFAFSVWQRWKHLIVGWLPRVHDEYRVGNISGYHYHRGIERQRYAKYSMILTGECFLHVSYLRMFNSSLPRSIHKMIDRIQSCEDIAMNVLVAHHLAKSGQPQCPGLLVKPKRRIQNLENQTKSQFRGLWKRPNDLSTRHNCLNKLAKVFGGMPLRYSHLIVYPTNA